MAKLEDLKRGASVKGILPDAQVTVVDVQWHGSNAITLTYRDAEGGTAQELLQREPDFGVTSVNDNLNELLARAEEPG